MATSTGGSFLKKLIICARRRLIRSVGWSRWSIPCSVKTAFDVSIPIRLYCVTGGSSWLFAAPILALDAVGPSTPTGAASPGRGGRMSRQRKAAAVLRLLRGEDLETVSRGLGVTAATLSGWRDAFLTAGEAALATKSATGEELESDRLKAKLGTALIERDLLIEKIAVLEANRPLGRRMFRP